MIIILKRPSWGSAGKSEFQKQSFYFCICGFPCHCHRFNPSSCHLLPFCLSYVAASRPYMLLFSIVPYRATII